MTSVPGHLFDYLHSGGQKSPGPTVEKARTALVKWCPAVNNDGRFGRWGYVEITMLDVRTRLDDAIDSLYDDGPVTGDKDLQDYQRTLVNEVLSGR